ncbi:MAG TPA: hypothetical protein VMW16_08705 [Sedimentisphaerales bacterium]|nr:hypothetical protein [Sedimentisphaerales bacterium]
MNNLEVTTGFGFFTDSQGHIIAKAELPKGTHALRDGYTYSEVADKAALDQVQVWIDPEQIKTAQDETLIQNEIRRAAIQALKSAGKLPAEFPEPV